MKTPEEVAAELAKRYTVDDGYVPDVDHWPALQRAIATAIRTARAEGMHEAEDGPCGWPALVYEIRKLYAQRSPYSAQAAAEWSELRARANAAISRADVMRDKAHAAMEAADNLSKAVMAERDAALAELARVREHVTTCRSGCDLCSEGLYLCGGGGA